MPFSGIGTRVTRITQQSTQCLLCKGVRQRSTILGHSRIAWHEARKHGRTRRSTQRQCAIGILKPHPHSGQTIHIGRMQVGITRTTHGVGRLLVGHDINDVRTMLTRPCCERKHRPTNKKQSIIHSDLVIRVILIFQTIIHLYFIQWNGKKLMFARHKVESGHKSFFRRQIDRCF